MGRRPRRLYHLAIPPVAFSSMIRLLGRTGLAERKRVIIEALWDRSASAQALNATVHAAFDESQVFRIDHFLGKESVDNILAFRFANGLFEPIWNRDHLRYVQIDVPESLTIEGRAAFYEETFRDMVVTHLFQVLGFVGMEPRPRWPQAAAGREDQGVRGPATARRAPRRARSSTAATGRSPVRPRSDTETFVALKAEIDNWRWAGVPFYLRTGKALAAQRSVITLEFARTDAADVPVRRRRQPQRGRGGDEIVIDFADPGSIAVRFQAKEPGPTMRLGSAEMTFNYADSFAAANDLEGYERLIPGHARRSGALHRSDGIERLWEISMPLLDRPAARAALRRRVMGA